MDDATVTQILSSLSYNPDTGVILRNQRSGRGKAGCRADVLHKQSGCRCVCLNYKHYSAHRLAWLLYYKVWPMGEIDHVNGNRADNRIENLREVTHRDNQYNQEVHRKGATPCIMSRNGGFSARFSFGNKKLYLSGCATEKEAISLLVRLRRAVGIPVEEGDLFSSYVDKEDIPP